MVCVLGRGSGSLSGGESVDSGRDGDRELLQPKCSKRTSRKRDALSHEETETLLDDSGIHENSAQENGDYGDGHLYVDSPVAKKQTLPEPRVSRQLSIGTTIALVDAGIQLMSPTLAKPQAPQAKPQSQPPQSQDSTQTFPPPRLAPPPKSIGPRVGTKQQAQPIRLPTGDGQPPIRLPGGAVEGQQLSPEVIVDPLNLSPSASPGMIKSLKELDNQDQQLLNQQPPSPHPRDPNDNQPPSLQTNNTPLVGVQMHGGGGKPTEPPLFKSHSTHARLQGTPPSPASLDSNLTADITDRSCPMSHPLEKSHSEGDKDTATRDSNLLNTLTIDDPKIAYIDETNSIDDSQ